jgi:hypothetical protein
VGPTKEKREEEDWVVCRKSAQRHCRVLKSFALFQTLLQVANHFEFKSSFAF